MIASFGIYAPRHLLNLNPNSFFGRRRKFAMDMIGPIEETGDAVLRTRFVEQLFDNKSVSKRTYANRFPEFDLALVEEIVRLGPKTPLTVLDVAISDGSTSVDYLRRLEGRVGKSITFTATDRDGKYLVLRRKGDGERRVIASPRGEFVQVVVPPFVFASRANEHPLLFPINRAYRPFAVGYARLIIDAWKAGAGDIQCSEFFFASMEFRNLLATDPRVRFQIYDISTPWEGGGCIAYER